MKTIGLLISVLCVGALASIARATDWDDCASELDSLHRAARDAAAAAEEASSRQDEFEDCDDPDDEAACDTERDDFEEAKSDAESELDRVLSKFRAAAAACDVYLSGALAASSSTSAQAPLAVNYHGNIESRIFHSGDCRWFNCKACATNFRMRDEAIKAGYRPCNVCKP